MFQSQFIGRDCFLFLYSGEVVVRTACRPEETIVARENLYPLAYQCYQPVEVEALSDAELLIFPAKELRNVLCWSQMAEFQRVQIAGDPTRDEDAQWINFILDSNLFFKVPPTNVSTIFSKLRRQVVNRGDVVVQQGEVGEACYFIKYGLAAVTISDVETGEEKLVAKIGPGRCFGEDALVNQTQRNATVTMLQDGVLMRLEKDDFLPLMKKDLAAVVELDYLLENIGHDDRCILIDVRTEAEYEFGHLESAINISLDILPLHLPRLRRDVEYILYSDSGFRSNAGAVAMQKLGYNVCSFATGLADLYASMVLNPSLKPLITQKRYWVKGGAVVSDHPRGVTI
ncbi:hypothetical protein GCM10025791_02240 [Halioxenophilus aromaticivorans]|uniref:Cyclic nucleotide-binding domain-containing protein n=1 Tax=Halioxenophilus aromaticivorans TaxID=1306992 RepID=A0AAV3TWE1_9ALTE